jgi:hypothetical protein
MRVDKFDLNTRDVHGPTKPSVDALQDNTLKDSICLIVSMFSTE